MNQQYLSVEDRDWTNTAVDRTHNLALGKKTKQIATFYENHSDKAVDGNMNPDASNGGCAITPGTTGGSWWEVNLEAVYQIREVVITSRGDCCRKFWTFSTQHNFSIEQLLMYQINNFLDTSTCDNFHSCMLFL